MQKQKNYEELTIRDPFMFGKICSKPENRKLILDSLLQIDFKEKSGEIEKHIQEYRDSKYSRLDLSKLPQSIRNMLEYINSGMTSDSATESIDNEVIEARLKEKWRSEYMLTLVHDKDVYRDGFEDGLTRGFEDGISKGFDSRQPEVDSLTKALTDKEAELAARNTELEGLKRELAKYKNI